MTILKDCKSILYQYYLGLTELVLLESYKTGENILQVTADKH